MRTLVVLSAAALLLAAPGFAGKASSLDITVLVKQATAKIRANPQFKKAVLLEADGTPAHGSTTKASEVTHWRIVFQNQTTNRSKYASAWIKVVNGKLGQVHGVKSPFVEDRNITVIPKMTLAAAVAKLRKAGHTEPFEAVTLRWPLGPKKGETLYIFSYDSGANWAVGTKSGKVKRLT
jgi:hypothetical protein